MSFQAYLDNIHAKTGKPAGDIAALVKGRGLEKPAEIIEWLKAEFGLGHGHAMAIVSLVRSEATPARSADDRIDAYFSGAKAKWRATFDRLVRDVARFGPDVAVSPGASYLSLTRGGRKFAVVQATAQRFDLGVKLRGAAARGRLEDAGAWNAMVTHRIRIGADAELDTEALGWVKAAYAKP